jgi:hypothetical protein
LRQKPRLDRVGATQRHRYDGVFLLIKLFHGESTSSNLGGGITREKEQLSARRRSPFRNQQETEISLLTIDKSQPDLDKIVKKYLSI